MWTPPLDNHHAPEYRVRITRLEDTLLRATDRSKIKPKAIHDAMEALRTHEVKADWTTVAEDRRSPQESDPVENHTAGFTGPADPRSEEVIPSIEDSDWNETADRYLTPSPHEISDSSDSEVGTRLPELRPPKRRRSEGSF